MSSDLGSAKSGSSQSQSGARCCGNIGLDLNAGFETDPAGCAVHGTSASLPWNGQNWSGTHIINADEQIELVLECPADWQSCSDFELTLAWDCNGSTTQKTVNPSDCACDPFELVFADIEFAADANCTECRNSGSVNLTVTLTQ